MSTSRRTIEVVDHDPAWAERFVDECTRIQEALASTAVRDQVVAIEHIGSTAVPGLAAKPVVDVMVGIRRFPAPPEVIAALESLGYIHHGEAAMAGRHYLTDAPKGHPRTCHVHVVEHGSWFWREHLRFRDRLRHHADEAASYAALKRDLAGQHRHDPIAYTEGKNGFVRAVLARARAEAGEDRIHGAAAEGFDVAADVYERARPGYPAEAVSHLVDRLDLGAHRRVVDLGAGTGKLTRALVPTGAEIIAVEPVLGMRSVLEAALPDVEVLDGTAEELPIEMSTVDAVVAGQAFHWFDPWMALSEAHRVLRDGGAVGLVWNVRDDTVGWVRRWTELLRPVSDGAPRERTSRWRSALERTSLFTDAETATYPNPHVVSRQALVERIASTSFVAALDEPRRHDLVDAFRCLLDTDPETRGRDEIAVPYRTEVHVSSRIP